MGTFGSRGGYLQYIPTKEGEKNNKPGAECLLNNGPYHGKEKGNALRDTVPANRKNIKKGLLPQ